VNRFAAVLFDLDDTLLDRRGSVERYLAGHAKRANVDPQPAISFHARFWALDDNGTELDRSCSSSLSRNSQ